MRTDRPVVLMGFAEALAAVESAWNLMEHGYEVVAFARRGKRSAVRLVRGARPVDISPPEDDAAGAVGDLAELVDSLRPAAVLPLCDQSLWLCDQLRERLGVSTMPPVAGPVGEQARLALDKRVQLELARRAGLLTPPSVEVTPEYAAGSWSPPGSAPWIVKPALAVQERDGRLHRPVGKIAWDTDVARAMVADVGGPVIVQPTLIGAGEGVFGLSTGRGVEAWSAHKRVRMMNPAGSGSSAATSIPVDAELRAAAERFVRLAGWRGIFMLEFLRDSQGHAYFMELNGRSWGSMALACRRGFAYPAWAVMTCLDSGFRPTPPLDPRHLVCRYLGGELIHLAFVMRGPRGRDPREWPSRRRAVREVFAVRRGEAWYNRRKGQPAVLVADTCFALGAQWARWRSR